jgi:hypothetical protein
LLLVCEKRIFEDKSAVHTDTNDYKTMLSFNNADAQLSQNPGLNLAFASLSHVRQKALQPNERFRRVYDPIPSTFVRC